MRFRPFYHTDPFIQLIVLFLVAFMCMSLFLLMAQGLVSFLWGVNLMEQLQGVQDFENTQVVHINRVALLFQHLGLFVAPALVFSLLVSPGWKSFLGFRRPHVLWLLSGAGCMLLALPVINATAWANEQLHFPESLRSLELALQQMEEGAERLTKALTSTTDFGILVLNILVMALVPALGEEMVFRGLIQPIAMRWTRRTHLAIWLTAFLFSALHLQFYGFVPRLLLGALLGYMYHWSGSLWVPILAHFANNAMALTLFFFIARGSISDEIEQFNATSGEWAVVGVAALALGAWLYVLCRKRVSAQPEPEANVGEPETDGE